MSERVFRDRRDAGRVLAGLLEHYRGRDVVVLGLPRGGVPVAYEVATALDAPLDVCRSNIELRSLSWAYAAW